MREGFKIERQYVTMLTMEEVNRLGYVAQNETDGGIFIPHSNPETVKQKLIDNLIIPRR